MSFYPIFFFSWFIYAAFVGLGLSLYRFARPVSLWFLFVSVLIVVPILIMLWKQDILENSSSVNKPMSVLAFIGFAAALYSLKYVPCHNKMAAWFICCSALGACLLWGFVGGQLFAPLLFVPDAQLLLAHVEFSAFFLTVTTGSYFYFRWLWKRQKREGIANVEGTKIHPMNGWVRVKALLIKIIKITALSYILGLFITIVFGCLAVRVAAVKAIKLPEPIDHFRDTTGGGLTSGGHYYSCGTYSFIPFFVGVWYRWEVQNDKPELWRGLDGEAKYIWIPAVCSIKLSGKTQPFVFFTNGHRYEAIPK